MSIRAIRRRAAVPALLGIAVLVWQLVQDRPSPALIVAGMLACVPYLATWTIRLY